MKEIVKQYDAAFKDIPEIMIQKEIEEFDTSRHSNVWVRYYNFFGSLGTNLSQTTKTFWGKWLNKMVVEDCYL